MSEASRPLAEGAGLVELILAMAEARGEHPALVAPTGTISYAALRAAVEQGAQGLNAADLEPQARVALMLPHGTDPILASLACMRAGCIFVHLDPRDPDERLLEILADCTPTVVITDDAGAARLRECHYAGRTETWDRMLGLGQSTACKALSIPPPESFLYLFYTSGSTGKPKGVLQTHHNLLHFASTYAERLGIGSADRLSLLYTLSFSAANLDVFPALLQGATVCLYELRTLGVAGLADWIAQVGVTVLHTVPSVFRALVNGPGQRELLAVVRVVDLGGEPVYAADILQARRQLSAACRIFNHYAQTEAMVIAQHEITDGDLAETARALPVGSPSHGMQFSIQDEEGKPAATGQIGQVVLHSAYISPGYWGSVPLGTLGNPADVRRFVSGDLGFLDEHGVLRCTGRGNQRVKIDGQSVHLEEVERALHRIAAVSQGVVIADERPGGTVLTAFVELKAPLPDVGQELRGALKAWLPPYMVPARITVLEALPRTQSGKIDRLALDRMARAIEHTASTAAATSVAPTMAGEIAAVFSELLGGTACTVDQDFFALGGSSLKAMELHMRLEQRYGRDLPLETLLLSATPRFLADVIATRSPAAPGQSRPLTLSLNTHGQRPALFLVHGYNGQAMVSRDFVTLTGKDRPLHAFQATGLDLSRNWTLPDIAATYVEALLARSNGRPFALGGLCIGTYLAVEMARQMLARGIRLPPLFLFDPAPFNPGNRWMPSFLRARVDGKDRMADQRRRILKRVTQGRSLVNADDASVLDEAARAGAVFLTALEQHRVRAFDHPVVLFTSHHRAMELASWRSTVRSKLKNIRARHMVGESHTDMLAPGNPVFASALTAELTALDEWAASTGL